MWLYCNCKWNYRDVYQHVSPPFDNIFIGYKTIRLFNQDRLIHIEILLWGLIMCWIFLFKLAFLNSKIILAASGLISLFVDFTSLILFYCSSQPLEVPSLPTFPPEIISSILSLPHFFYFKLSSFRLFYPFLISSILSLPHFSYFTSTLKYSDYDRLIVYHKC